MFVIVAIVLGVLVSAAVIGVSGNSTRDPGAIARIDAAAIGRVIDRSVVDISTALSGARGHVAATGIVLSATGTVLTNNHVIAGATTISARVGGTGRRYVAVVTGYDVTDDIAVLRLDGAADLVPAPIGDPATVRVGDAMVAVGNARGLGGIPHAAAGHVVALGQRVAATNRAGFDGETLPDTIEVSATVQPGDSGGPLVDADGRVIGLIAATSTGARSRDATAIGGFAIPIDRATAIARTISAGRSTAAVHVGPRAVLGVAIKTTQSIPGVDLVHGAVVGLADNNGPARAAGLRAGDVIVAVDGVDVSSVADLDAALDQRRPGDVVQLYWTTTTGLPGTAAVRLVTGPPL